MCLKVHEAADHSGLSALFLFLLFLSGAGCGQQNDAAENLPPGFNQSRFGDPYQVMLNTAPAEPDSPPALAGDSLIATLSYAGGCKDHDFDLEHEAARDTTRLWLRHDDNGDDCEALIFDTLRMPVPSSALASRTIVLLNPMGGPPFMLRWGH